MPTLEKADSLSVLLLGKGRGEDRRFSLVVHGLSMSPFFDEGQTVTVDCGPENSVGVGDVIVFEVEGRLCAHRVLAMRCRDGEPGYLQKGDNQLLRSVVARSDILGKVVALDGHPLPLSTGLVASSARWFYAKWAYALSGIAALLEYPPLRRAGFTPPSMERAIRTGCVRASRGLLKLLLFLFKAPAPAKL